MNTEPMIDKWIAFRWKVIEIDAHNFDEIDSAIKQAKAVKDSPVMIVANSIKGKGVSFMENECAWHGKAPSVEESERAKREILSQKIY